MSIDIINPNYSAYLNSTKNGSNASGASGDFSNALNSAVSNRKTTNLDVIFEKASQKYNVPVNLLKAVAKAESNFNAKAQSGCGAQGIMQLMPATARSLGVTDSFDPEQNIMGGAKYLSQMLQRFDGNTKLALAAYNAGPNNVVKYSGIPPFKETQNYVVKVMGYMGGNLSAGTVTQKINTRVSANDSDASQSSSSDSAEFLRSMGLLPAGLDEDKLDGEDYARLLNIYQYKLQISLLTGTDFDKL